MYASASSIGLIVVEVDAVEDLVGNAKIERSGDNVPQLIKTGSATAKFCQVICQVPPRFLQANIAYIIHCLYRLTVSGNGGFSSRLCS